MYARNTWDISIPLKAADVIKMATVPLNITITYNDNYFIEKQKNETVINLPVRLTGDLNIISCTVPNEVSKGAKARISATYENKGSENLYNVVMKVLTGDEQEAITTNLYSIAGGKKNTAEVYIECKDLGDIPVNIVFSYEDEKGEVYQSEEFVYNMTVVENEELKYDTDQLVASIGGVSTITYVLLAAIVVIVILILFIIKRRRR